MQDLNLAQPQGLGSKRGSWVLVSAAFLTFILYLVPFLRPLSYPFLLLSTLVHEMGHGLAAVVFGGHFDSFNMWLNGSGVAKISGNFGRFSQAMVAAFGLVGPAILAAVFFSALKSPRRSKVSLATFGIILLLSILLVVRNWFGLLFVGALAVLCLFFSLGAAKKYAQELTAFLAVQLGLSVFSRSDYLFTDVAQTSMGAMPSDVALMSQALFLPYWFFGALCGLFSIAILYFGLKKTFE